LYGASEPGSLVSSLAADAKCKSGASVNSRRDCGGFARPLALDTKVRVEPEENGLKEARARVKSGSGGTRGHSLFSSSHPLPPTL
jgi:hypothetical protein